MLIGLTRDLKAGDRFQVELQFEKTGKLVVEPEVRQP
jgi:copper(I)-binding protein